MNRNESNPIEKRTMGSISSYESLLTPLLISVSGFDFRRSLRLALQSTAGNK
ncbi:hypothetical protein [Priestia megaterium]|uniref:hypothetical protein n=1 Tax=Priestia megaterium TaxID=1404 RepID=UPI0013F4C82F|nr:hypothetical protein [Priestia megaterium]